MATIKTQLINNSRFVIAKVFDGQRRISCSCCEEAACCMYPADQLGVLYASADLPNEIYIYWQGNDVQDPFPPVNSIFQKDGSKFVSGTQTLDIQDGLWTLSDSEEPLITYQTLCLIIDQFPFINCLELGLAPDEGCVNIQDLFEDTYTIDTDFGSGQVNRTALCTWRGTDDNGCPLRLRYIDDINAGPSALKWLLSWSSYDPDVGCDQFFSGIKSSGNQSSPVGTYADNGAFATVS